jgi:hypothetical protein
VDFIFGLPGNAVLSRLVEVAADDVRVGLDDRPAGYRICSNRSRHSAATSANRRRAAGSG